MIPDPIPVYETSLTYIGQHFADQISLVGASTPKALRKFATEACSPCPDPPVIHQFQSVWHSVSKCDETTFATPLTSVLSCQPLPFLNMLRGWMLIMTSRAVRGFDRSAPVIHRLANCCTLSNQGRYDNFAS